MVKKKDYLIDILETANNKNLTIKIDDELFGSIEIKFDEYSYEILENGIKFIDLKDVGRESFYEFKEIISFKIDTSYENVIEAIKNCKYLTTMNAFVKDPDEEMQKVIDEKSHEIFLQDLTHYEYALQYEIKEKIGVGVSNSLIESVYNDLVVNILKKKKIETWGDFYEFRKAMKHSDDLIEKLIQAKQEDIF